jgi:hypothetical protein
MRLSRTPRIHKSRGIARLHQATRALVEAMETRTLLSAGGGFTAAGITGSYYNNATLNGSPAFTRVDTRIDFNFGTTGTPGGSTDPQFAAIGTTNWSASWNGQVIPKYSETYTFTVTSEGAARLYIVPSGQAYGSPLINDFTQHTAQAVDTGTYALTAGSIYNIELQYETTSTPSEIKLHWSGNSTPDEAIEPAEAVGLNVDGGDGLFANMVNGATRNYWWAAGNTNAYATVDSNFWPTTDGEIFLGEGDITLNSGGTYLMQFKGAATVSFQNFSATFHVGSNSYSSLPDGTGYNSSTNLTTATIVIGPGNYNGFILDFTNTSREGNHTTPQHDGITNLYVMQPTTLGGSTDPSPGTLFTNAALTQLSQYSTLRAMGLLDTNGTIASNWTDRTLVSDQVWNGWEVTGGTGVTYNTSNSLGAGVPWEVLVAMANETGKDLYINIPSNASLTYINDVADLFAFGSDGTNPYTSVTSNPVWAPLNSNLKVYIEFSNEIWNFGFSQAGTGGNGWIDQISQRALYDYWTNNQSDSLYPGGGANGYNDGKLIDPLYNTGSAGITAFDATYNGANANWPGYGSPQYFSNGDTNLQGFTVYQGWVALRLEQISAAFKNVMGENAINADSNSSRVRPLFEWQYGGSWDGELADMQTLFGSTNRVGYYLYGGGAGWYADDTYNGFFDSTFTNGNFATTPAVTGYAKDPTGTGWTFNNGSISNNSSGIAANGSTLANPVAPTIGPANNPTGSNQTAYLMPGSSISQSVTFSGGWADITLLAAQTIANNYNSGITIAIDGTNVAESEGPWWGYAGSQGSWTWERTAAFNVSAGTHTVTITNVNASSGGATVFIDNLGIQTVSGIFSETTSKGAPLPGSGNSVPSDVKICQQYGLLDVGYEGGFDFNQSYSSGGATGYSTMYPGKGYSSTTPNVGVEASLDPRTVALAQNTITQFFQDGGTLPVVFEGYGNVNSWAVAAPTYFNTNTPKQQAVDATEQALPAAGTFASTNVPNTIYPSYKNQDYSDSNGSLSSGGWIDWNIIVPVTGTYTFTATTTTGGSYRLSLNDLNTLGTGTSGGVINPTATLTPGVYTLKMEDTSGAFTVSQIVVSEAGAPASPVITSAVLTTNGSTASATLSWNSSTGATGYLVGYGPSAGQYTTFVDEGNTFTATITGLSTTAVYHFAVYAYNAGQARSLPSADVRLAPRSTDASVFVNFLDQPVSDGDLTHVIEPLVEGNFAFTSFGNTGGSGMFIVDTGNDWYPYPGKTLTGGSWGNSQQIARTDGHTFDLYSLQLFEFQADSAVITATDNSGGTETDVVNFTPAGSYATAQPILDWTDLTQVQITWWSGTNGTGSGRNGGVDNLVFDDAPPVITSATATPSTVTGVSTLLSASATDTKTASSSLLYTWTATTLPTGAAAPKFTANNTNAAQNTTAYFTATGSYVFTVAVTDGASLVSNQTVAVTVSQTSSGITVTPVSPTVLDTATQQLTATVGDQFGKAIGTQPSFTWSMASGLGSVNSSGKYTPPSTGSGWAYINVSGGTYTATAAVYYTASLSPNYVSGFTSGAITTVGSTTALTTTSSPLDLTPGSAGPGAAWYNTKLSTSSFVSDFGFQISAVPGQGENGQYGGDGITFTIQNSANNAIGSNGTGLGYQGITNSIALKFDLTPWDSSWSSGTWNSASGVGNAELDSTGIFTNGAAPTTPATDLSNTNIQLRSGDVFQAHLSYNGSNLSVTLVDITNVNHWSVTETYAVNIPSVVGASTAWFGFTGGGGGGGSYQDVLWWTYGQPQATITPVAATQTAGLPGVTLNFNRPVNGFNLADLSLTLNGSTVPLGSTPIIGTPSGEMSYALTNLTSLTSAPGTYVLTASAAGLADGGGNSPASNLTATWTVSKTSDTTVVTSSGTPSTYGQSVTFTATVTPTSGSGETGTVEFIVDGSNASNATLSGNTATYAISNLSAGTHTISAVFSGDSSFASSTSSNFSETINKATLLVTATSTSKTYGSANPTFADSITGFVNSDPGSVVSGTATLTTTANTSSGVGSYPINVSQGTLAASNYTFTFAGGTLTVNPATLTVTATSTSKTYGSANPTFADTITGFVNSDPGMVVSGTANLTTTATTSSGVGSYPINVSQGTLTAANYTFTFAGGTLTVNPATLTVTATSTSKTYGSANPTFADTITGLVNGDAGSVVSGTANLTTTATTSSGVGTYPINVSQGTLTAANYTFTFAGGTLTVNPATLTVTATSASKAYGSANPTLADTITGFVNSDPASVVTGTASLTTAATASSNVGSYPINVSQGTLAAANYTFTFVGGTLLVSPLASTTVVTSSNASSAYGQSVTFTATVTPDTGAGPTGTVEFVIDGSNASNVALSGNTASYTLSTLGAGSHSISAIYSGDANFNASTSTSFSQSVSGALALTGSNYLEIDPVTAGQLDIWAGTSNNGSLTSTYQISQLSGLADSGTGATLNLDFTNGSPVPSGGLTFNGSSGDALIVTGSASASANTASIGGSTLTFDSSTINLPGVSTVTINTGAGNDALTQTSQPAATSVVFNGGTGSDQLNVNAGSYTFTADPQPLTSNLSVTASGTGTQVVFSPESGRAIHFAGLTLSSGAAASVSSLGASRANGNQRVLVIGSPGATSAPQFDIDASSQLDLADNDLVIHDGNLSSTYSILQSGYNTTAGGYWNGKGILSSVAASTSLTTLGLSQPASAGIFDGETVATNDVLVKYTYYGDAALSGTVNSADYTLVDNGYLGKLTGWSNGDFNYDGVVNGSDYTLIDNAFNQQGASLATQIAAASGSPASSKTPASPQGQSFNAISSGIGTSTNSVTRRKRLVFSLLPLELPELSVG